MEDVSDHHRPGAGVSIRLAGLVTIEQDGAPPRHLSSAQAQVAFARLTLERSSGTVRDQLADTIWPDGLPDTWASALRSVVSRVRAFVAGTDDPTAAPVVAQGGRYLLRLPPDATVDVEAAEAQVAEATRAYGDGAFTDAQRLAVAAVSCLQASFLPDHEGEWVSGVREHLHELLVSALETASLAAASLRDDRNALRFADEAVRRAPLRESAHRCRMAAHVAAGNRAEALRCYHHLRRLLAEELGVDPAPETEAAYVDILGSPVSPTVRSGQSRPSPTPAAPFVGRWAEVAALGEAWSRAEAGAGALVLVTGEAGVGKTRLATEAARRVSLSGGLVMYGRCDPSSVVPYQPFAEALGGYVAATPDDLLPPLSTTVRQALATLTAGGEQRSEFFLAVADLLLRTARERPVFLVLDDLDLADEETLGLLRHVHRARSGAALLMVATARAVAGRAIVDTVREIDKDGWLRRLALRGLAEADVAVLAQRVLGGATLPHDAPPPHRLAADTAGNAYLLLELLRWHRESGGSSEVRGIPSGIHEYATARLAVLEAPARRLLHVAAVSGRSFELDLVAQAAELDADRATEALDGLVGHGLVVEVVTASRGRAHVHEYRFTHDILRRAVYEQFSDARRRWLHARMADAIEQLRPGDLSRYSRAQAHHGAAGAAPHGDQRAVRWGWRAAARATQDRALNEAVRLHRQALEHVPPSDHALRAEALTNLGLAELAAGAPGCDQTLLDGALLAVHSGRRNIAAQGALGLADAVGTRPRVRSEAAALIDLLVRGATGDLRGQPVPATLDSINAVTLGRLLARQSRLGAAVAGGAVARTALDALGRELRLLEGPDYVRRRLTLAEEMLVVAAATGDTHAQILADHHRAMAAELAGDIDVRTEALAAMAASAGDGEPFGDALLVDHSVALAVTQGRFTDAVATARLGGPAGRDTDHGIAPAPGSLAVRQLVIAAWLRGEPWPATGAARPDSTPPDGQAAAERSLAALIEGDRGWAHLSVRAMATGAEPLPSGDEWPHVVGVLALAAVELGDPTTAEALRRLLTPYADLTCGVGYRTFVGPASLHLGRLAVVIGDWAEAERHLTAALAQLAGRQARPWLALAQQSLAEALQARARTGDQRWAEALRAEADRTLVTLGLPRRAR
jgi:DNA-binding SARP family transcriptional activator